MAEELKMVTDDLESHKARNDELLRRKWRKLIKDVI